MHVFLTGANDWISSVVAQDLPDAGHSVVGLVRSAAKGEAFAAKGVTPLVGSLGDLAVLRKGAADADGIGHTAFGLDFSKISELSSEESAALEAFGEVYAGSGRPIIVTGGVLVTPPGRRSGRTQGRPSIKFPRASEQTAC